MIDAAGCPNWPRMPSTGRFGSGQGSGDFGSADFRRMARPPPAVMLYGLRPDGDTADAPFRRCIPVCAGLCARRPGAGHHPGSGHGRSGLDRRTGRSALLERRRQIDLLQPQAQGLERARPASRRPGRLDRCRRRSRLDGGRRWPACRIRQCAHPRRIRAQWRCIPARDRQRTPDPGHANDREGDLAAVLRGWPGAAVPRRQRLVQP